MEKRIIVNVKPDGSSSTRFEGFQGEECFLKGKPIEEALGKIEKTERTQDYYRPNLEQVDVQAQNGNGK